MKNAAAGNADLVAYIGHDGLMDFQLNTTYKNTDGKTRYVIILACYSKRFFEPHLQHAKVNPLVWTSGLMAAEAYTLHDALTGYVNGESDEQIACVLLRLMLNTKNAVRKQRGTCFGNSC